ncbi:MAG: hypothetical protein AB7S26_14995 [Sandaracinaceae bacterium]
MPTVPPRPTPERVTDTYAIARWKGLVLWVVDGQTPVSELEQLIELSKRHNARYGDPRNVALTIIHGTPSGMSAEERAAAARLIESTKHTRVASSTVVLARGLVAAVHRSILTGISLLVPPPHPVKVCSDVPSALSFLQPHIESLCGPIAPDHIEAMASQLHDAVTERRLIRARD